MSALANPWQQQGAFLSLRTRKHSSSVLTTEFRSGSPDENANEPIPTGRINERIVGIHDFDSTLFIAVLFVLLGSVVVSLTISMYRKWALWSVLVVTGLLGANFSASILTAFGIKDAVVTRVLGIEQRFAVSEPPHLLTNRIPFRSRRLVWP
jgi:hypothetical protein